MTARWFTRVCLLPLLLASPAVAQGPGQGSGSRHVGSSPPATESKSEASDAAKASHQQGAAPARPSPTLPEGAERAAEDVESRREIAGGPTADDLRAGVDDRELRAIRAAERVLFPKPIAGLNSGWSWDVKGDPGGGLPELLDIRSGSDVSGLAAATQPTGRDAEWLESLTMPNLPVRLDERVVKYLKFYRDEPRGQAVVHIWARKVGRYAPALRAELARAGLPTDLVWLSLIESGHNPTIVSPAGAAGLWQFIPDTGRLYGLTVDRWVDERFDPQRATQAAIRFLSDLRSRFGNWEMAMAAYNMGQGGLLRSVRKYNTNDYWRLTRYEAGIPWETTLYVPKIMAIAIVMNNKRAFGIDKITPDDPVTFDSIKVESGTTLASVAAASSVSVETLQALNPQLLAQRAPPEESGSKRFWWVHVPKGTGTAVSARLAKSRRPRAASEPVVVRFGDTLETIAKRYHSSEGRLRSMNAIEPGEQLYPGQVLLIPPLGDDKQPAADQEDWIVVSAKQRSYPGRKRVFYQVLHGDSVESIAHAFGVGVADLMIWNSLDDSASLQGGMSLQLYVPNDADLSGVRFLTADSTKVFEVGSKEFFDHFEGLKGRSRVVVAARKGDTLRSIGKRYGMSTSMMERINRFSRRRALSPGDRVVVYTKHPVPKRDVAEPRRVSLPSLKSTADREAKADPPSKK